MENLKYFDFSKQFGENIFAILTQKDSLIKRMSHEERICFYANKLNIKSNNLGIPVQSHSNNCIIIKKYGSYENIDGLITKNKNIVLSISVADCCPIYIYDKEMKIRGLIHSGWKGTVNKICNNAIDKFLKLKSDILNLSIYLGPSIGPCCYEVENDVAKYFYGHCKTKTINGKFLVNIREQIKTDLIEIGINCNQIKISSVCTLENSKCESYRRDKKKSGRMIAFFKEIKY